MDSFGNLREWDRVLGQLAIMKETKTLNLYQSGLARILRYRKNWRLLERVLEYGKYISQPTDEFLEEIYQVMSDPEIYPDARIQALKTLECLILNRPSNAPIVHSLLNVWERVENMNLAGPPVFQEALSASLGKLREISDPRP